jgi:glycosyltransferase involved in cell wall biosynthesis
MTISCIIACYNGEKYLEDTVKSIVDQDYTDWEIIFLNDGSTDQSQKKMVDLKIGYNISDKVFIYAYSQNRGITITKQTGFQMAHGDYIVSLDTDDFISPDYMSKTLDCLISNPNFDYIYPDTVYHYPDGNQQRFEQPEFSIINLINANFISYATLMRKKAFLDTGYDLNNRGKQEDYQLHLRMARKGHYGKHLALPLFHYRIHEGQSIDASDVKNWDHLFKAYFVKQMPEMFPPQWWSVAEKQLEGLPDNFMQLTGKDFEEVVKIK